MAMFWNKVYDGALGWTVTETAEGTRFTHDSTGHGMLVTAQDAYPF